MRLCSSGSGDDSEKDSSSNGSSLGTGGMSSRFDMPAVKSADPRQTCR